MLACEIRLKHFYRFGKSDMRRNKLDLGKTSFFDVWKDAVPAAFKNDMKMC